MLIYQDGQGNIRTGQGTVLLTIPGGGALNISTGKTLACTQTLTLAGVASKTLTINNSITLTGTDGTVMTFPTTTASVARIDASQTFAAAGVQTFAGHVARTGKVVVNNNATSPYVVGANVGVVLFTGTNVTTVSVTLPAAAAALDGAIISIYSTAAISVAFAVTSVGATIVGVPATLAALGSVSVIYDHATTQWIKIAD